MNMQRMLVFMMACATAFSASAEEIHNGRFKGPGDQLGIPSGWFNDTPASVGGRSKSCRRRMSAWSVFAASPPWTIYIFASHRT